MDINRLPKWAQREFTGLQQAKDTLERELRQFQGAEDSPITIRRPTSLDFYPVPPGTVRFKVNSFDTGHIDIRIDGDNLDITGGTLILQIQPMAANHIRLTLTNKEATNGNSN